MTVRDSLFAVICLMASGCSRGPGPLFTLVPPEKSGITFNNSIEETPERNVMLYEYYYNGGGVAAGDFNNDGLVDLYFTANAGDNRLYLNKGDLTFDDVTKAAGVAGRDGWKTGAAVADVNGDGWLDIYVSYSGPVLKENLYEELYINSGVLQPGGIPTFTERAKEFGLDTPFTFTTQGVFFDFDNDGDLDLFQSNHGHRYYSPYFHTTRVRNKRHPQFGNRLYRNDGDRFTEVSEAAGIHGGGLNFGLSAGVSDLNDDGWPDLYVTNDFEEQDFVYLNRGDGTFRDVSKKAMGHTSKFAMGSDIADFNNDLLSDVLVVDMLPATLERQKLLKGPDDFHLYSLMVDSGFHHQHMRNTLQMNRGTDDTGSPVFSEVGQLAGIQATDWSWSALMADFDNDGFKDIFITNGFLRDFTNMDFLKYTYQDAAAEARRKNTIVPVYELIKKMPSTTLSNYVFRNQDGIRFSDETRNWGLDVPMMSFGATYADLDNDGDLEIVTNNTNAVASVWKNHAKENTGRSSVRIRLRGKGSNTSAIGAKVIVSTTDFRQSGEVVLSRGFQSSVDGVLHFGTGTGSAPVSVEVRWPGGRTTVHENIQPGGIAEISETGAMPVRSAGAEIHPRPGLLRDISKESSPDFRFLENDYVDFTAYPLLLHQLSREGPHLAKGDVNGDGLEDLYVGGASGAAGRLFIQQKNGRLVPASQPDFELDKEHEDAGAVFLDADGDGDLDLYVTSGGAEFPVGHPLLQDRFYENTGKGRFSRSPSAIPVERSNGSCVAAGDYDKDGDVDLFVGGGTDRGKFPFPATGGILRNDTGARGSIRFSVATPQVNAALRSPGMITAAMWADLDGDSWPELVLAGKWMPLQIYQNDRGVLRFADAGLAETDGLWMSLAADDVDGDGDVDIVAGNAGENFPWRPTAEKPLTLYGHDFDGNGTIDPVICVREGSRDFPVASRDELLEQIPSLRKKFVYYTDYAQADMTRLFPSDVLASARRLHAKTLATVYLENKGGNRFLVHRLPAEAQFSGVQGIVAGDFDSDGRKDLLIAGNYFPYRVQYGKSDASVGVLLKGDGQGGFTPLGRSRSGFFAPGDVRAMTTLKGNNGAIIVVAKNGDGLQVFATAPDGNPGNLAGHSKR